MPTTISTAGVNNTLPAGEALPTATHAAGAAVATAAATDAAEVAVAVLTAGGNAYDAAVAAALVENVWLPMKCGLGGDLVALVREPDGRIETLLSIGPGGARFSPEAGLTVTGPRSIGVPGAPDGYAALAARGRLGLAELAAPAIARARAGVAWLPVAVELTGEAEAKLRALNGPIPFLPGGELPRAGAALRLPGLAALIEAFVRLGHELFWHEIGASLVARLDRAGGLLSRDDLRVRPARWMAPARMTSRGVGISATPAPTHGTRLLAALRSVLEDGAPPVSAVRDAAERSPAVSESGTSVVAAGDREGRGVVVVHSNSFPNFGSCVVLEEYDLVLNNRPGRGFDLSVARDHPNAPAPGRVPDTTLHAWSVDAGATRCLGATPGGANQAPWNLQTILDLVGGMRPEDAATAPRWSLGGRGELLVEADHPDSGLDGRKIPPLSQRSAQQLLVVRDDGWLACADPRIGAVARAVDGRAP